MKLVEANENIQQKLVDTAIKQATIFVACTSIRIELHSPRSLQLVLITLLAYGNSASKIFRGTIQLFKD